MRETTTAIIRTKHKDSFTLEEQQQKINKYIHSIENKKNGIENGKRYNKKNNNKIKNKRIAKKDFF